LKNYQEVRFRLAGILKWDPDTTFFITYRNH